MKALTRNTLLAIPVAIILDLVLPAGFDLLDAFTIAFSCCYIGYLVEKLLLRIPGIETGGGRIIRVLGWFAGGLWCYVLARWALVAYGRDTSELPSLVWGGFIFVGLQFVLHAILQASGKPNFYTGQVEEVGTSSGQRSY